jgi:hypothetical protein
MGSIIRDFKANDVYDAEQEDNLYQKIDMLEEALEKAESFKSEYGDLYQEASDLVDELETLIGDTQMDLDRQREEDWYE